ncbi:MAG: alpha/beta hydrolase [Solirubrobacteraceae bacterium]
MNASSLFRSLARRAVLVSSIAIAATAATGVASAQQTGVRYLDPVFTDVDVTKDVVFGQAVNNFGELQVLRLDLYKPAGDSITNRPAMVFAHGGGFTMGDKADDRQQPFLKGMAQRGYVVMSINYRMRPPGTPGANRGPEGLIINSAVGDDATMRDGQHDMQAAVRWTRQNAETLGVNPAMIVVSGGSAGGVMALETAFNPEDPGGSGNPGVSSAVAAAVSLWGAADPDHIEAGAPPVIDFHGTIDPTLPAWAPSCARTSALGNVCEQTIWPDGTHAAWDRTDQILATAPGFLCRYVIKTCTAPVPLVPITVGSVGALKP